MHKVGDYIARDFVVAQPYQGTALYRKNLLKGEPVVVKEDGSFLGVLTLNDLVAQPHHLVIDTLSPKPMVSSEDEIFPVLLSMCHNNFEFLPVMDKGEFEGLISRKRLFIELLDGDLSENIPEQEHVQELKKELAFKDKFLTIIGHDVKNMFNQVLGSMELLDHRLQHVNDPKMLAVLQLARKSAEQVNSAFEGMLLWARLESGQLYFTPERLSLNEQFSKIADQFQLAGNVKQIAIRNLLIDELEIYADRNMLGCILLNLTYNAIKFTPSGGEIWLDAKSMDDKTQIEVTDSGLGISSKRKKQLFKKMIPSPGTLKEIGSGIGLVICKDFVEKHNGTMELESEEGKGTKVIVTFPKEQFKNNAMLSQQGHTAS